MNAILVVGSVGYDTISTPLGQRRRILGGSANYFSYAASAFAPVRVVGVVGEDYQASDREILSSRGVSLEGLQTVPGKTFAWEGRYERDMNQAITLATELNVLADFSPKVPASYRDSETVFLANIDPVLQLEVLEQVARPTLVAADTMNYWITSKRADILNVLKKIDVLLVNEAELEQLTGEANAIAAAKKAATLGPRVVVVKRGEYGFLLLTEGRFFIGPAFPVEDVVDPTGAGDSFAGGFLGHLSSLGRGYDREDLKQACITGCLAASFTVQDFGLDGLKESSLSGLADRLKTYRTVVS